MKKLFLLAAAATTLVACTQNEVLETAANDSAQTPVTFETYLSKSTTRATNLKKDNMKTFGVFAYQTKTEVTAKAIGEKKANFMYDQYVHGGNSTTATNSWTYAPIVYWPNNDETNGNYVSFVAYAPYVGAGDGTAETTAANCLSLVKNDGSTAFENTVTDVPWVKYDFAGTDTKVDFMYAQTVNETKGSRGHLLADGVTYSEGTSDDAHVLLQFKHALARIADFSKIDVKYRADELNNVADASAKDIADKNSVVLHKVTITVKGKAGKVGTFDLDAQAWQSAGASYYDAGAEVGSVTYGAGKGEAGDLNQTVTKTATTLSGSLTGNIMIIPAADPTNEDLTIEAQAWYTVTTTDSKVEGDQVVVTNHCTASSIVHLDKNQDLQIHLVLGLTSIKFETDVNAWETTSGGSDIETEVDLPANAAHVTP